MNNSRHALGQFRNSSDECNKVMVEENKIFTFAAVEMSVIQVEPMPHLVGQGVAFIETILTPAGK